MMNLLKSINPRWLIAIRSAVVHSALLLGALSANVMRAAEPGDYSRGVAGIHGLGRRLADARSVRSRVDCPLVAYRALALLWAGARGETAAEIAAVLDHSPDQSLWADLEVLDRRIRPSDGRSAPVALVERLWMQDGFAIESGFKRFVRSQGGEAPIGVDFHADSEDARKRINGSIREATGQRIAELLPTGAVTAETRLVLACMAFFHGRWAEGFDRSLTRRERFRGVSGATRVPMMNRTGRMEYGMQDGWQIVVLPFDDGRTSMAILLPAPEADMGQAWAQQPAWGASIPERREVRNVQLALPRFQVESSGNLADRLIELGMPLAFSPKAADFSGISRDLYLFGFHQGVSVRVDENGATASAASAAVMMQKGGMPQMDPPVEFRADRPFCFHIYDLETGLIWFSGCVVDLPDSV
jgi:serpin B